MQLTSGSVTNSYYEVVVVRPTRVAHYGEFEVFSLIEGSPVCIYMINNSNHIYLWWIRLSVPKFTNISFLILLVVLDYSNSLGSSLLPFCCHAYFVEMSYFVTGFALGILCRTRLPWLVFTFPTSHALAFHPWGFSRLMSRIRRSLLSRFILCCWF